MLVKEPGNEATISARSLATVSLRMFREQPFSVIIGSKHEIRPFSVIVRGDIDCGRWRSGVSQLINNTAYSQGF